jgi:hypothetical protein
VIATKVYGRMRLGQNAADQAIRRLFALASVNVKLSADEITSLEEPYMPRAVVGFV